LAPAAGSVPSVPTLMGVSAWWVAAVVVVGLAAADVATIAALVWWEYRGGEPWR
jgi:hypothetical protein